MYQIFVVRFGSLDITSKICKIIKRIKKYMFRARTKHRNKSDNMILIDKVLNLKTVSLRKIGSATYPVLPL